MTTPRGKDSRGDILLLLLLVALLLGGAFLVNRRSSSTDRLDESVVLPRHVPEGLVKYQEGRAIELESERLRGLAVGPDDKIYVLAGFHLQAYDPDGAFVRAYELSVAPHCASFGPNGRLYLGLGRRVGVIHLSSGDVVEWPPLGDQSLTASVAAGKQAVLVGDSGERTLWVFDLEGRELARHTNAGAAEGEGDAPSVHFDVARTPDDTYWCTDAGRHRVLHYSATGELLGRIGEKGEEIEKFGGCCNPAHLAAFPDGRLLVVEKKPDLVKIVQPDGTLDCVVAPPSAFATKTFLADAAIDSAGRVLVLDPRHKQVRIFVPMEDGE